VTYPAAQPGRHAASAALSASRARAEPGHANGPRYPRERRTLSPERAQDILGQFAAGDFCVYCLGIHAGLSLPGCPRIATFELDADGKLRAATYFPDGDWNTSGVYFTDDVEEDEPGE
jgi:hypothetical protein